MNQKRKKKTFKTNQRRKSQKKKKERKKKKEGKEKKLLFSRPDRNRIKEGPSSPIPHNDNIIRRSKEGIGNDTLKTGQGGSFYSLSLSLFLICFFFFFFFFYKIK
jgi:hypothetical protein